MVLAFAGVAVIASGHIAAPGRGVKFCHTGSQGLQCQVCTRDPG